MKKLSKLVSVSALGFALVFTPYFAHAEGTASTTTVSASSTASPNTTGKESALDKIQQSLDKLKAKEDLLTQRAAFIKEVQTLKSLRTQNKSLNTELRTSIKNFKTSIHAQIKSMRKSKDLSKVTELKGNVTSVKSEMEKLKGIRDSREQYIKLAKEKFKAKDYSGAITEIKAGETKATALITEKKHAITLINNYQSN